MDQRARLDGPNKRLDGPDGPDGPTLSK